MICINNECYNSLSEAANLLAISENDITTLIDKTIIARPPIVIDIKSNATIYVYPYNYIVLLEAAFKYNTLIETAKFDEVEKRNLKKTVLSKATTKFKYDKRLFRYIQKMKKPDIKEISSLIEAVPEYYIIGGIMELYTFENNYTISWQGELPPSNLVSIANKLISSYEMENLENIGTKVRYQIKNQPFKHFKLDEDRENHDIFIAQHSKDIVFARLDYPSPYFRIATRPFSSAWGSPEISVNFFNKIAPGLFDLFEETTSDDYKIPRNLRIKYINKIYSLLDQELNKKNDF